MYVSTVTLLVACRESPEPDPQDEPWVDHGPIAEGVYAPMGEPVPYATEEQLAAFERGLAVALHKFDRSEGLGPAFNITFCAACHEKPVVGGAAGLYRNFFLGGHTTDDGAFLMDPSADNPSGVIRMYAYDDEIPARPPVAPTAEIFAQRNPIPFFGVGLLAELTSDEILSRADEGDEDGDGISGRPNWDKGFVGRFGMKSQTVSIEGFIRGPLNNHLGITTDPLTDDQRKLLPIDSSSSSQGRAGLSALGSLLQAAAPEGPLTDDDAAPDPEMSTEELFDLVSFAMLLAPPQPEPFDERNKAARRNFDEARCSGCHTPRLQSERGPLPVYSDLLVHDMGEELADGIVMKEASGSEFRTAPLWGVAATGPYLHDGRAATLQEAILAHGGEAAASRDAFIDLSAEEQAGIITFLESLGGLSQRTEGLIPPNTPIASVGAYGGPVRELSAEEEQQFLAGRAIFDRDFSIAEGVGGPRFNGDSCRACHFQPVVGGAGPRDVNVMRHGILEDDGRFVTPTVGTVLHKQTSLDNNPLRAQPEAAVFEHRQTPHLFGLGLIDELPESVILERADPDDIDGDGISGKPSWTDGGRLGRFGWKAQVPSVDEFVRDAVTTELGMTLPYQEGLTFGLIFDNDEVPDPEYDPQDAADLAFYLRTLGPPPSPPPAPTPLFFRFGCAECHTPSLQGPSGPVRLYSDLLLHDVLEPGTPGIEDASATVTEFRTPPLWGLSQTAPYLHSGAADTIDGAIRAHAGEAAAARAAYSSASLTDRRALLLFLESL